MIGMIEKVLIIKIKLIKQIIVQTKINNQTNLRHD